MPAPQLATVPAGDGALAAADLRSAEILGSIREVFAQKGFDGASMQDLARAAGMSVGNFYRYFPSKSAIVEAIAARDLAEMEADFAAVVTSPDPLQMLRQIIRGKLEGSSCTLDGSLWAEITAAAFRKPEIAVVMTSMDRAITGHLTAIFALVTGLCPENAASRFGAQAGLIVMMVKSSMIDAGRGAIARDRLNESVLQVIDGILDGIAAPAFSRSAGRA